MRIRTAFAATAAAIIFSASLGASAQSGSQVYREALDLYEHGMYERAMELFETQKNDVLCYGYSVLCAVKMNTEDCREKVLDYEMTYPESILSSKIHYQLGMNLFDEGDYDSAAAEYAKVRFKDLSEKETAEMVFKNGYSAFQLGDDTTAADEFEKVAGMVHTEYTAPSQYWLGYINYNHRRFAKAEEWFRESVKDDRFKDLSEFYIVDCRFMQKDYDFVIKEATAIYDSVPQERQARLSRMLSEAYMVKGNAKMAKEYLSRENLSGDEMTRSDYFHAGTVLYEVQDYAGAIRNYVKMEDRSDSLGQIANYHLGNAYIKTKNKVSALDSFRDAASVSFDKDIREDAYFNYAKLSFDINHDASVFESYLKEYSTSKKGDKIYSYIALSCIYNHDYAGAVEAYDHIDDLDQEQKSNYMKAYYLRAEQLISSGAYSDAIPCLKAAAYYVPRQDPFNQLSRYWMGESYYRTERYDEALKTYQDLNNNSALEGKEEGNVLPYNIAYSYFRLGNFDQAAKWFDSYVAGGDKAFREDAMVRRADCDYIRKDYKAAIAQYQKVRDEYNDVNDIYPYYRQAVAYGLTNDKKKKVETLAPVMGASKIAPYYSEALYELGRAYMDVKDSEKAAEAFNALRYNTSDNTYVARALIGLGMVSRNSGEYDNALSYYKQVVELMPGSEYSDDALLAIESIYQTRKQPEKYMEYVEENQIAAGKTDADKEQMYYNTAEQVFLAENYSQAIVSLEKYISLYPEGSKLHEAYFYMAESYRCLGNKEKACEYYTLCLKKNETGSFAENAMLNYASLCASLERYDEAYAGYSDLEQKAQIDANKATAQVGMMRTAYRGKQYEKAISAATAVEGNASSSDDLKREAKYVQAQSYLATSRRDEAYPIFESLSARPYTAEGAEAVYMLIQRSFDKGDFEDVEKRVYDFANKAGSQSYWLAKSFIVLGDSFLERGNTAQAKATYQSVRDGYSSDQNDDIADNVKMRLDRLETTSSK